MSLIQVPMGKGDFDFLWDHSMKPDFVLSPWPKLPWKSVLKRKPADYHIQGLESYPAYVGFAFGSSWFWKEIAFEFRGGVSRQDSLSGADYLYLYWLARYAGWLEPD